MIYSHQRALRLADAASRGAQAVKRLRRCNLVHQVQVDVEQRRLAGRLAHYVLLPDLFEQGARTGGAKCVFAGGLKFCIHGSKQVLRSRFLALTRSGALPQDDNHSLLTQHDTPAGGR